MGDLGVTQEVKGQLKGERDVRGDLELQRLASRLQAEVEEEEELQR